MTIVMTSVCLGAGIRHIHPTSLLHHLYKTNIKMYTTWHEKTKCSTKHSISENLAVFCSSETYMLRQGSWKLQCSPSIKWNQARIRKKLSQHHKVILPQTQAKHWIMVPPSPQGKKWLTVQRFTGAGTSPVYSALPTTDQSIQQLKFRNN